MRKAIDAFKTFDKTKVLNFDAIQAHTKDLYPRELEIFIHLLRSVYKIFDSPNYVQWYLDVLPRLYEENSTIRGRVFMHELCPSLSLLSKNVKLVEKALDANSKNYVVAYLLKEKLDMISHSHN